MKLRTLTICAIVAWLAVAALVVFLTACDSTALPISIADLGWLELLDQAPADASTPASHDGSSACSASSVPACGAFSGGIRPCLDGAGRALTIGLPARTLGGIYGPPSLCYQAHVDAAAFCQQDPTSVPAGYPYLLVADCSTCAVCP